MAAMETALVRELDLRIAAENPDFQQLQSIYFGGGTPSLFHLSGLEALLKRLIPHENAYANQQFPFDPWPE